MTTLENNGKTKQILLSLKHNYYSKRIMLRINETALICYTCFTSCFNFNRLKGLDRESIT